VHLGPVRLKFFGSAGHDRYRHDFFRIELARFGIIGFGQCPEHLLRRLAGRKVIELLGVHVFDVLDPTGRAGSVHGQLDRFIVIDQCLFKAGKQFGSLLHDGEVGGKIGIEYRVEAQVFQGGYHFTGYPFAWFKAKLFAQPDPNSRGCLHHQVFGGVGNGFPHLFDIVFLDEGTGWTVVYTLSAVGTYHLVHRVLEKGRNFHVIAFVGHRKCVYPLQLGAGAHTTLAADTAAIVLDDRGRIHIDRVVFKVVQVDQILRHDFVLSSQFLQFTVAVFITFGAVGIVLRKQQFNDLFSGVPNL